MFEVSAEWMQACGYGSEAKAFSIIRTWNEGNLLFVEVDKEGHPWTLIATWRGRFI